MNRDVLNSWKEIAAYMGRGLRTVQRWQRDLGLPVRRSSGRGGAVCADPRELDRWLHNIPQTPRPQMEPAGPSTGGTPSFSENWEWRSSLAENRACVRRQSRELAMRSLQIRQRALDTLVLAKQICDRQAERTRTHHH